MDHKKKFDELYSHIVGSRDTRKMKMLGWVMKAMMEQAIENHPQLAEEYINVLESVRWDNYLTEAEAEKIVKVMQPAPKWSKPTWKELMGERDLDMEQYPCYNSCALYVTMSMIDSDSGKTIKDLMARSDKAIDVDTYFDAVHALALDKLKDEDGVFNIRRYFKDVLWPEDGAR